MHKIEINGVEVMVDETTYRRIVKVAKSNGLTIDQAVIFCLKKVTRKVN